MINISDELLSILRKLEVDPGECYHIKIDAPVEKGAVTVSCYHTENGRKVADLEKGEVKRKEPITFTVATNPTEAYGRIWGADTQTTLHTGSREAVEDLVKQILEVEE